MTINDNRPPNSNTPILPQKEPTSGIVKFQFVSDLKREQARSLRKRSTTAERILWTYLRNRQLDGLKFRRQQVIYGFIADFYCEEAKLVIEVDGSIHDLEEIKKYDQHRENVFKSKKLNIIRFRNEQIINQIDFVLDAIKTTARKYC